MKCLPLFALALPSFVALSAPSTLSRDEACSLAEAAFFADASRTRGCPASGGTNDDIGAYALENCTNFRVDAKQGTAEVEMLEVARGCETRQVMSCRSRVFDFKRFEDGWKALHAGDAGDMMGPWARGCPGPAARPDAVRAAIALKPSSGVHRLGVLGVPGDMWRDIRDALEVLGYLEGRNLVIVSRSCDPTGDTARCASHASELVALKVDAIVTAGSARTRMAQSATRTMPIVTDAGDPIGSGFAKSLAKPGGNITGVTISSQERYRKQIELMRLVAPKTTLLVALVADRQRQTRFLMGPLEAAAREVHMPLEWKLVGAGKAPFEAAMKEIGRRGGSALLALPIEKDFVAIAIRHRVPTIVDRPLAVKEGWLLTYLTGNPGERRRMAAQLDKIFRGVRPAEIPFEVATRSWFFINRSTAAALGLSLDPGIFALADEVFE